MPPMIPEIAPWMYTPEQSEVSKSPFWTDAAAEFATQLADIPSIAPRSAHGTPNVRNPSRKIVYFHSLYLQDSRTPVSGRRTPALDAAGARVIATIHSPVCAHDGARDDAKQTERDCQCARHLDVEERG